jgi:glutamate---cysteine ligase / carboxylate-amine ligase
VIERHFGESALFSLGVEEEIMILDAGTLSQRPESATFVRESEGLTLPGRLKTELFASVVELNTNIAGDAEEALAALVELRRAAREIAERHGLRLAAAGSHPLDQPLDQEIAPEERYLEFVAYAGVSARRQGVSGLHVHVGMPSPDDCMRALEGILPWLPLLLALSANSPYLAGEVTGLASNRAEILAMLPRHGAPPAFTSYAQWERHVERLARLRLPADYTALWWDVRPHPRFGTLEIRMPDQPTSVRRSGAFVAVVQALCATVLRAKPRRRDAGLRGIYQQNRWAALRFGPRAELIHPDGKRLVSVPEQAAELLELVTPAARELGGADLLDALGVDGSEGDRQLEVGRGGDLRAVCADLADRTLRSN